MLVLTSPEYRTGVVLANYDTYFHVGADVPSNLAYGTLVKAPPPNMNDVLFLVNGDKDLTGITEAFLESPAFNASLV
jgi:hypothetical protein